MNIIELSDDFSAKKEKIMNECGYPADYESILKNLPIDEQLKHFQFVREDDGKAFGVEEWGVHAALVQNGIIYGFVVSIPEFMGSHKTWLYVNRYHLYDEDYEVDGGGYNTYNEQYAQLKFIP